MDPLIHQHGEIHSLARKRSDFSLLSLILSIIFVVAVRETMVRFHQTLSSWKTKQKTNSTRDTSHIDKERQQLRVIPYQKLKPAMADVRPRNDPHDSTTITGLFGDLKRLRFGDVATLLNLFTAKQKGVQDDRQLLLENMIQLLSKLDTKEKLSRQLTGGFVNTLWDERQHPNLRTLDAKFQYRTSDGSCNNILWPDLGRAGSAYARSTKSAILQNIALPDPGEIFDLLMARVSQFEPHPNGISSMLFNFATLITHDIFKTNHLDFTKSDTSSYLDLSPLYGNNDEEQADVRLFENGLLKPDCFSEKRLLDFPPAVGLLVIMFNRFHNHVATNLATINENGRFNKPKDSTALEVWIKYDNDLFQTARLITCGLYINCVLKDYVRTILSLNRTESKWDLDPRLSDSKAHLNTPEGVGNQVAAEFNLVYRWHSAISKKDAEWTEKRFTQLFDGKGPEEVTMKELFTALGKLKMKVPKDPLQRPFAGLVRDPTTLKFDDKELVKILTDSIEDVAGSFGANKVPRAMRGIEILGIIQSRKWEVGTLNEFRAYVGLTKYETFEDINPDPEVASRLRDLYQHPDYVELYPGLVTEKAKPALSPGSGLCVNFTTSYAILSDAVSLVRGDRFYTIDYTPKALTNWGFNEANFDRDIDDGCVFHKLIRTSFPQHFDSQSIYAHYPLVTPTENWKIMESLNRSSTYSWDVPRQIRSCFIASATLCRRVLNNKNFQRSSLVAQGVSSLTPSHRKLKFSEQGSQILQAIVAAHLTQNTTELLEHNARNGGCRCDTKKVDVVRNIISRATATLCTELLGANDSSKVELYRCLTLLAQRQDLSSLVTGRLRHTVEKIVCEVANLSYLSRFIQRPKHVSPIAKYGQQLIRGMLEDKICDRNTLSSELLYLVQHIMGFYTQLVTESLDYYLGSGRDHLSSIFHLARMNTTEADERIAKYFLEGVRLNTALHMERKCTPQEGTDAVTFQDGHETISLQQGDIAILDFAAASQDPAIYPDPAQVKLDRPLDSYLPYTAAIDPYISSGASLAGMTAMVKVLCSLKNLRRATGSGEDGAWYGESQGEIKRVVSEDGLIRYMTPDQSEYSDRPMSMMVMWDAE